MYRKKYDIKYDTYTVFTISNSISQGKYKTLTVIFSTKNLKLISFLIYTF